jgi:HNH endonuclease
MGTRKPNRPEALTFEEVSALLEYRDGAVYAKQTRSSRALAGTRMGHDINGYNVTTLHYRKYKISRIVWMLHHGVWPTGVIDHINHDTKDDRIENLRDVAQSHNMQNQVRAPRHSTLRVLGVSPAQPGGRGPTAHINVGGRNIHLGTFDTIDEAHQAYVTAKRRLHEGNTL